MRQLVYTMFITNNGASLSLWWKENLVKYQKVTKYNENVCRSGSKLLVCDSGKDIKLLVSVLPGLRPQFVFDHRCPKYVFHGPPPPSICIYRPRSSVCVCLFFFLQIKVVKVTVSTYINHSHKKRNSVSYDYVYGDIPHALYKLSV